jgi:alpha-beta hydrolase superfamily lysophospholipase
LVEQICSSVVDEINYRHFGYSKTYYMSGPKLLKVLLFIFIYQNMQAQSIQVGHIKANNYDFTYLEAGKGQLVLLFHGFPDNPYTFISQIKALAAAGYHAVAPYKRGFSPRDTVLNPVQHASLYMQDAAALVDALNLMR